MAIATTDEAILRGKISEYLSANDNSNGQLFGGRIASPFSALTITIVTDALDWGNYAGQNAITLREITNYLIWLIGAYGQEAQAILNGGGGGTVIPIPPAGGVITPITISGSDFANTTDWDYAQYAGKEFTVFSNGIARYLTFGSEWIYTTGGFTILMPGFDSALMDYTMVITLIR